MLPIAERRKDYGSRMPSQIKNPVPKLAFSGHNLRRNPFGELTATQLMKVAEVDVEELVSFLHQPRTAVQFSGDKGFGKTTHLFSLRDAIPTAGYVHIPEGERRPIPEGQPVMIDEAQRLTWLQQRKLFRGQASLVLGTHRDFERSLRNNGFRVKAINVERLADVNRTWRILNARIRLFVRDDRCPSPTVSKETAGELHRRFQGCLRAIMHEMYVRFQTIENSTGEACVSL